MVAAGAAVVAVVAPAGPAHADPAAFMGAAELPRGRTFGEQLADAFSELGVVIDEHLGVLTNDVVDLRIDGRHRRGRIRVHGDVASASVAVDSDIRFEHGGARVKARLDLRLGDHHLEVDLPDFEVRPTSVDGERGVVISVPLLSGSF